MKNWRPVVMNQRAELNLSENCVLTDAISESTGPMVRWSVLARVMDAAWKRTCRFEVLESLVNAPLEFCPFRKVVLSAGGHQLGFGGPCRRFELVLAGDQLGVEETQIQRTELGRPSVVSKGSERFTDEFLENRAANPRDDLRDEDEEEYCDQQSHEVGGRSHTFTATCTMIGR
jgi:hypothetical protein